MRAMLGVLTSFFLLALGSGAAIAAQTPATARDLETKAELLKKQLEFNEAQKQLLEAQRALEEAQRAGSAPTPDELTAVQTAKELADARRALAEARRAQSDAELAAFKASLGEVPASGLSGTVQEQGAGGLEAALLAMTAVREASGTIGARIRALLPNESRVLAMAAGDVPTFQHMMAYDSEVALIHSVLEDAVAAADTTQPIRAGAPVLGAAGFLLDATSKLLSFFRTDYTVQGIALTLEDAVAVHEVAGNLAEASHGKALLVSVPAIYDPSALTSRAQFFIDDVKKLSGLRAKGDAHVARLEARIAADKARGRRASEEHELLVDLKGAVALMDSWYARLRAPDNQGTATLVQVIKEKAIGASLDGGYLLVVKVQKSGGGVMTKKNLWTFFGEMPLYHMGGAAVSYSLIDGTTGFVRSSGVVPVHGGFVKSKALRRTLAR